VFDTDVPTCHPYGFDELSLFLEVCCNITKERCSVDVTGIAVVILTFGFSRIDDDIGLSA
jgi:hypothetical protein